VKRVSLLGATLVANLLVPLAGCRTTRPEVPPPPKFAANGLKRQTPIGFGSAPKAGYMTDAATQSAPGIAAPGGDQTSVASRQNQTDPAKSKFPDDAPPPTDLRTPSTSPLASSGKPKGMGVGGIFNGLGSSTGAKKDDAVVTAGSTAELPPPVSPIDPPVTLPPPPLVPPPAGVSAPGAMPGKAQSEQSPAALPHESAIPPVVAEPTP